MRNPRNPQFTMGNRLMISVLLDPDQLSVIDQAATDRRTSRAALIREAIDLYIKENRLLLPTPASSSEVVTT